MGGNYLGAFPTSFSRARLKFVAKGNRNMNINYIFFFF